MGLAIKAGSLSISSSGNVGGGVIVSNTAPEANATILWIDTGNGGIAKYYNGTAWTPIVSVWG